MPSMGRDDERAFVAQIGGVVLSSSEQEKMKGEAKVVEA